MIRRLCKYAVAAALLLGSVPQVYAERMFVRDQVWVGIRAENNLASPIVKVITTGDRVDVLQRSGGYALVRDDAGVEGWVEPDYLMATEPAAVRLETVNAELTKVRAELTETRDRLALAAKGSDIGTTKGVTSPEWTPLNIALVFGASGGLLFAVGVWVGRTLMRQKFKRRFPEQLF